MVRVERHAGGRGEVAGPGVAQAGHPFVIGQHATGAMAAPRGHGVVDVLPKHTVVDFVVGSTAPIALHQV